MICRTQSGPFQVIEGYGRPSASEALLRRDIRIVGETELIEPQRIGRAAVFAPKHRRRRVGRHLGFWLLIALWLFGTSAILWWGFA